MKNKIFEAVTISTSKITIPKNRARKDLGDLTDLKESLEKSGLINPLLITKDYVLVAGERRLTIIKELGWDSVDVRITPDINSDDLMIIEMMENIARKDFTWAEEITLKLNIHAYWAAEAKKKKEKNHGFRATAEKLGCSIGTLSTDLVLAAAIKTFPYLTDFDTKAKAKATYKKLGEQVESIQAIDNLSKEEQANLTSMISGNFKPTKAANGDVKLNIPKAMHEDCIPSISELKSCSTNEQSSSAVKTKVKKEVAYSVEHYKDFLIKIPKKSAGFIELDPPYAIDFNTNYGKVSNIKAKATDWTIEQLFEFYTEYLPILFDKLLDASWILCWTGKEHWKETNKIAASSGFKVQPPGVWAKSGGSCNTPKTNMISNYENFLLFRKGNATFNTASFPSVINFDPPPASQRIHQWEKPVEMYRYFCTQLGRRGSLFLSPFVGSGNSLIAATHEGMLGMGCDDKQQYVYGFHERFNAIFN